MVNIIVVFRKIEDARNIRKVLVRNGFTVTAVCSTGLAAIELFDDFKNGIVVCGYQMTDMPYTEIYDNLPEDFQMLLMARESVLPMLRENDIVCLPMPARVRDLVETVSMMQRAIEANIRKKRSGAKSRSNEDKATIEDAKRLLMERNNMTEPEAHRYLQKTAMDTATSMAETAGMVLDLFSR
ncbi:MAG: ANTAR domain-containing protein [Lachnospiraceae bacterium]|nr:ANTAR domain-containing protein [Lachnospiraceae bacterium]